MTRPRRIDPTGALVVLGVVLLTGAAAAFGALASLLLGVATGALTAGVALLIVAWLVVPDDEASYPPR